MHLVQVLTLLSGEVSRHLVQPAAWTKVFFLTNSVLVQVPNISGCFPIGASVLALMECLPPKWQRSETLPWVVNLQARYRALPMQPVMIECCIQKREMGPPVSSMPSHRNCHTLNVVPHLYYNVTAFSPLSLCSWSLITTRVISNLYIWRYYATASNLPSFPQPHSQRLGSLGTSKHLSPYSGISLISQLCLHILIPCSIAGLTCTKANHLENDG